ncbi:hypothetical protein BH23PLA1_BH23PLA1_31480 [soil metagenome]
MPGPDNAALLVSYYEVLMKDRDLDGFEILVSARYTEGTLGRVLQSGNVQARRAAALALGLVGSFEINDVLAGALKDEDSGVRELAVKSLWSIWFRADSPENNATLQRVADLIVSGRYEQAEAQATRLIGRAPSFSEAYNQRAIALYAQGRHAESAADCRRVLQRNPYHIGALSGLGQCYLRLGQREEALETFHRALKLQPHDLGLRQTISVLEADGP